MPKGTQNNVQVTLDVPRSIIQKYVLIANATGKPTEYYLLKAMRDFITGVANISNVTKVKKPTAKKG